MNLLAVSTMSATFQALFFGFAVLCFLVAAFAQDRVERVNLVALGLASATIVFFWNALAAA